MTSLRKAVDILSALLANNMDLTRDEYYKKLIGVFNQTTELQMEITNPSFNKSVFSYYSYIVENNNAPIANIIINNTDPNDDIKALITLMGVLITNKYYYDVMRNNAKSMAATEELRHILSYTETVAVKNLFKDYELEPWAEKTLVTSKLADKIGITRSVIVNAIRKMEMTGIVHTQSLGMKGTAITVLNKDNLNKLLRAI